MGAIFIMGPVFGVFVGIIAAIVTAGRRRRAKPPIGLYICRIVGGGRYLRRGHLAGATTDWRSRNHDMFRAQLIRMQ